MRRHRDAFQVAWLVAALFAIVGCGGGSPSPSDGGAGKGGSSTGGLGGAGGRGGVGGGGTGGVGAAGTSGGTGGGTGGGTAGASAGTGGGVAGEGGSTAGRGGASAGTGGGAAGAGGSTAGRGGASAGTGGGAAGAGGGNAGTGGGSAGAGGTAGAGGGGGGTGGTSCQSSFPAHFQCNSRPQSTCAACLTALGGGETVCSCLTGSAATDCQALLICLSPGYFNCVAGGGGYVCYCSDDTCSNGANGRCASAYHAVAGTTDPAQVLQQLKDPTTTVYRVVKEADRWGLHTAACGMYCGCLGNPS